MDTTPLIGLIRARTCLPWAERGTLQTYMDGRADLFTTFSVFFLKEFIAFSKHAVLQLWPAKIYIGISKYLQVDFLSCFRSIFYGCDLLFCHLLERRRGVRFTGRCSVCRHSVVVICLEIVFSFSFFFLRFAGQQPFSHRPHRTTIRRRAVQLHLHLRLPPARRIRADVRGCCLLFCPP